MREECDVKDAQRAQDIPALARLQVDAKAVKTYHHIRRCRRVTGIQDSGRG